MSKRRNADANSSREKNPVSLIWNSSMDEKLIELYIHQDIIGNRVGSVFTPTGMNNIVAKMQEQFPGKPFDKEKVKNCMKYIKSKWTACYDLFKNAGSGFAWNRNTKMWSAEPEVWERLIEAHPDAAEWRNKPIANDDKLLVLYAADRAAGDNSETAAEIRERRRASGVSNELDDLTIEGIDEMVSREEIFLDNFDEQPADREDGHRATSESRSTTNSQKKSKKAKFDVSVDKIYNGMEAVAEAIRDSAIEFNKGRENMPMKVDDIWDFLIKMGIENEQIEDAYVFLLNSPENLRGLLGCPLERRKSILMKMMQRASMPPPAHF